ncbi:MAG: response regulator transcription factor, partial [Micromonosporaceae bacterium]
MSVGAPGDGRTVLVVEDDHEIAELVRLYLVRDGYRVRIEHRGDTGLAAARSLRPAACVLDIALPGMDGVEVCRRLREAGDWTPIIFLTARDDEVDRVLGLELGADDYVTKPFSPRELVARVRAVLRRGAAPDEPPVRRVGPVVLDPGRRRVTVDGRPVSLTGTEFALLEYLMSRPGRV